MKGKVFSTMRIVVKDNEGSYIVMDCEIEDSQLQKESWGSQRPLALSYKEL